MDLSNLILVKLLLLILDKEKLPYGARAAKKGQIRKELGYLSDLGSLRMRIT